MYAPDMKWSIQKISGVFFFFFLFFFFEELIEESSNPLDLDAWNNLL